VAHRDARLAVRSRPLERRPDDALDAPGGVDLLSDVRLPFDATPPQVDTFGVLPKNYEIDVAVRLSDRPTVRPEGGEVGVEKANRPKVDVEIELEAQPEQDVAGVLVAGDAWVADGAEEDGVDIVPQFPKRRIRERLSRLQVVVGAVGEPLPRERDAVLPGGALDDRVRGLDHLRADAVAGDHGHAVGCLLSPTVRLSDRPTHSNPVARPQPAQYAQPTSTSAPHAGHLSSPSGGCPQC